MEVLLDKLITMEEAAGLVVSGSTLAIGGMTLYRRPAAFVLALLRRFRLTGEPQNLTLFAFTGGWECDLLIGAGMVTHLRSCYFGLEVFGLAPMFTYKTGQGELNIIEESEASLALGLRAEIARIGFMPGRAWIGTDMLKLRPDVHTITDPYTGEELVAFPAIPIDCAIIHALKADLDGNALIGGNKAVDEELLMASKQVIITSEEIVPELQHADLIAPLVHAVVPAPGGALPTSCHPLYPMDGEKILAYTEQVSDPANFEQYLTRLLNAQ
jgi:glutaconate CoA-transferase subunit A